MTLLLDRCVEHPLPPASIVRAAAEVPRFAVNTRVGWWSPTPPSGNSTSMSAASSSAQARETEHGPTLMEKTPLSLRRFLTPAHRKAIMITLPECFSGCRARGTGRFDEEERVTREKGIRTPYRIVMRSELSERYTAAFDGMQMETNNGETILVGEIVDQSHLLGILNHINGLGLQLLSVQALPEDARPNAEGELGSHTAQRRPKKLA